MINCNDENNIESFIGRQIRKRRHILGMSQSDLASKVGVTFQQIQKYEKGTNKIMASRLYELSKIMNVHLNYFFEEYKNKEDTTNFSLNEEQSEFIYKLPNSSPASPGQDALKLVKVYNKIPNDKSKKKLLGFLKSLTEDNE
ncbi:MAG: helix-turn-helix domain-containing protein [Rickettsiales bacterium]|jgi:transcriptional regulator with XRE-family HTH domain|nr:helix-turn-helix domain-containing protein [Rickettsiales bacterium]